MTTESEYNRVPYRSLILPIFPNPKGPSPMRYAVLLLLLTVKPVLAQPTTVKLTGHIVSADSGQPLPARLYIRSKTGTWHFARSAAGNGSAIRYDKERAGGKSVEKHTTLSAHPFVAELPPGDYTLTAERGHEYLTTKKTLRVGKQPVEVTLKLKRWINMADKGWYSGDTHVHRDLAELPNVMLAEDLNVALPLTYWVTTAFTPPKLGSKSSKKDPPARVFQMDKTHLIYPRNTEYEIFSVAGKRHTLGAFFVLNHKTIFEKGVPPVSSIAERAHQEGALLELDKPNWPWSMMLVPIMKIDLFELSNNHVWRTKFGFPKFGIPAPNYMKVDTDLNGFTEQGWIDFNFQNYYALLDCGFRLRPTAGTASGVHPVPLGFGRVYVHCEDFTYKNWMNGLDAGRSFVSTGPMLDVRLNKEFPGHTFKQEGTFSYKLRGTAVSAGPLDRIEVVINGEVAHKIQPQNGKTKSGAFSSSMNLDLKMDSSSWVAVRCFEIRNNRPRFAHTAPFHIDVAGKPLRPRKEEIAFLIQRVEDELKRHQGVLPKAALAEYRRGLEIYRRIAKTAR